MDEEIFTPLLDNEMAEIAHRFTPEHNIAELDYYKINGNLCLPDTTIATIANYLNDHEEDDPNCKVFQKLQDINL